MTTIRKQDTDGTKSLLGIGELGYDNNLSGGDKGRVYVGTGAENIALVHEKDIAIDGLDNAPGKLLTTGATINQLDLLDSNIEFTPSVKPTLDFDFVNETYTVYDGFGTGFVQKPLADAVTFARTTEATGVDPVGRVGTVGANVPRLVFEDGVGKGYLSEESRTNLLTNSEFPNGLSDAPIRGGLLTLDTIDYGEGAVNAIAFGYNASTPSWAYKTNHTPTIGTTYTLSVYVEMDDGGEPSFLSSNAPSFQNDFALVITGAVANPTSYIKERVFGNTYKITSTLTVTNAVPDAGIVKYGANSPRTFKVTGFQLEVGSFPTSYIKTLGSSVTRTSDSMTRTLGQEWNPNEGTFVVEFELNKIPVPSILGNMSGGQWLYVRTVTSDFRMFDGANLSPSAGVAQINTIYKAALRSTKTSMSVSINGGAVVTSVSSGNLLSIFSNLSIGNGFTCKSITYYPKAFDAATLQKLSRIS